MPISSAIALVLAWMVVPTNVALLPEYRQPDAVVDATEGIESKVVPGMTLDKALTILDRDNLSGIVHTATTTVAVFDYPSRRVAVWCSRDDVVRHVATSRQQNRR